VFANEETWKISLDKFGQISSQQVLKFIYILLGYMSASDNIQGGPN